MGVSIHTVDFNVGDFLIVSLAWSEIWNCLIVCIGWYNWDIWSLRECVIIGYSYFVCLQSQIVYPGSWCYLVAKHYLSPSPGLLSDLYWALGSWSSFGFCFFRIELSWVWLCCCLPFFSVGCSMFCCVEWLHRHVVRMEAGYGWVGGTCRISRVGHRVNELSHFCKCGPEFGCLDCCFLLLA